MANSYIMHIAWIYCTKELHISGGMEQDSMRYRHITQKVRNLKKTDLFKKFSILCPQAGYAVQLTEIQEYVRLGRSITSCG